MTQTTKLRWHILSPIPREGGRTSLCGLHNDAPFFDSPNEAYRAHVEGWDRVGLPCKRCADVFAIAIKVNEEYDDE